MFGAGGNIEGVAVPLEHRGAVAKGVQHGIFASGRRCAEVVPANLGLTMPAHRRAEHMRQKLRAQADAEHGLVLRQGLFDQAHLGHQVRTLVLILHVHGPAQHDQPVVAIHAGRGIRVALEIHIADAMPACADQWIERAEWLGGNVLQNQNAGHRKARRWRSGRRSNFARKPAATAMRLK